MAIENTTSDWHPCYIKDSVVTLCPSMSRFILENPNRVHLPFVINFGNNREGSLTPCVTWKDKTKIMMNVCCFCGHRYDKDDFNTGKPQFVTRTESPSPIPSPLGNAGFDRRIGN